MSLIVSQTPVNRLPAELVNNAAFIKKVDFDPVHETPKTEQPAVKINGTANRFDTISISAEALAMAKNISGLTSLNGAGATALDAGADVSQPVQQRTSILDITDPASVERKKQGDAMSRAMRSWNATVKELKQLSESSEAYGYSETIKLFKSGYVDWQTALRKSDPEAYDAWSRWLRMDKGEQSAGIQ